MKPEVSHPTRVCPNPLLWHCYDSEATELEVISFLKALVVVLKPKSILETGCYDGHSTSSLAKGALANGFGHVTSCDIGYDKIEATKRRLEECALQPWCTLHQGRGIDVINALTEPVDFAFLDSGPDDIRVQELRALLPHLSPEAVVAIHDVGPQHGLREHFDKAMPELGLQYIIFSTPRGLALLRKAQV